MRKADSMSTTKVSSRERDRLCINSSSCVRCKATSEMRASMSETRAALSCTVSWACLAQVLASSACKPVSALWRASCS